MTSEPISASLKIKMRLTSPTMITGMLVKMRTLTPLCELHCEGDYNSMHGKLALPCNSQAALAIRNLQSVCTHHVIFCPAHLTFSLTRPSLWGTLFQSMFCKNCPFLQSYYMVGENANPCVGLPPERK